MIVPPGLTATLPPLTVPDPSKKAWFPMVSVLVPFTVSLLPELM